MAARMAVSCKLSIGCLLPGFGIERSISHDLRPECDYSEYGPGEYPPDSCYPYKVRN
jgi:hypothetical protein